MSRDDILKIIKETIAESYSGYDSYSEIYQNDIEQTAEYAAESVWKALEEIGIILEKL